MCQSIPSLTILPPGYRRGFAHSHCPRGRVFSQLFLCLWGRDFESEKLFTVLKEICRQELLDLFQRNWRQLQKQVFLCCFIPMFAKTVDIYCICNKIDHFWPFRSFPRVIFAFARSSLKFQVSYIARFIINMWSVSRLFLRVFLSIASLENHRSFGTYYL